MHLVANDLWKSFYFLRWGKPTNFYYRKYEKKRKKIFFFFAISSSLEIAIGTFAKLKKLQETSPICYWITAI